MSIFPDPPDREPTTGRLFRRAVLLLAGLTVSYWLLGELQQRERNSLLLSAPFGLVMAYTDLVFTYAKRRWRHAVAPHHVVGLGVAGLIIGLTGIASTPANAAGGMVWWWLTAWVAVITLPTTLVVLGVRELRRRNQEVAEP